MSTNTEIIRKIIAEFPNLQNEKKTLEGNHEMTLREAIRALYPTLRDMKKRGFTIKDIAEKLDAYGVNIKPATLSKYMNVKEQEKSITRNCRSNSSTTHRLKKSASQSADSVTVHDTPTPNKAE